MIEKIKSAKQIAILTHIAPDGDAISSVFALKSFLMSMDKNAIVFLEQPIKVNNFFSNCVCETRIDNQNFDLLISVDTARDMLLGSFADFFVSNKEKTISIDHHSERTSFANEDYVKPYTSCTMVLMDLFEEFGVKYNKEVATFLFFGLITDSQRFMTTNTTTKTLEYAIKLIDAGADIQAVYDEVYRSESLTYVKNLAKIYDKLVVKNGVASVFVSIKDNIKEPQMFSGAIINIKDVKMSVIIYEVDGGKFNLSFRSKPPIDVSKIAKHFGGGGHINASGANQVEGTHQKILNKIEKLLQEQNG